MLQLNITQQPIKIEYTIHNAQLSLQSTPPKLDMETTLAKVDIHQPQGELTIDQTPCRYSMGLKNNEAFARDNAQRGAQTVQDTIVRIVEEGDRLARIESKENAIANIAGESIISDPPGVTLTAIAPPIIQYQANPPQFSPTEGKVNFSVQQGTVNGDYQPPSVGFHVTQYPSIAISVVDVKA